LEHLPRKEEGGMGEGGGGVGDGDEGKNMSCGGKIRKFCRESI